MCDYTNCTELLCVSSLAYMALDYKSIYFLLASCDLKKNYKHTYYSSELVALNDERFSVICLCHILLTSPHELQSRFQLRVLINSATVNMLYLSPG